MPATLDDAPAMAALHASLFAEAWSAVEVAHLIVGPTAAAFVARGCNAPPPGTGSASATIRASAVSASDMLTSEMPAGDMPAGITSASDISDATAPRATAWLDGFIIGRIVADEAEVLTIGVAPHARRQGLGAALIAALGGAARGAGAKRIFLEVAADNADACALYRHLGFTQLARRTGYYRRSASLTVDALCLALSL